MNLTLIKELQEKIANDAYLLYEALANLADDNTEKIASAIEAINDYVKEIGEVATQAHLTGLSMVCQQTGQNIATLSALDTEQLQTLGIEVERWPRLVSNYLYSPLNSKVHDQLIHFLQNDKWPQPIENELANQLHDSLKADFINQPDEIIESLIHEGISTNNSDTKTVNNIVNEEDQVTPDSSNESHSVTDQSLPANLLYHKIIEMNESLSIALTQVITLDAEEEGFFEGLNQYTDTIQLFWELAESLGLKGFQDVCTFINDNVFECSSLSQLEKKKLQKPLTLWPKKALNYLKKPDSNAQKLVNLLCIKHWPISLSMEKSEQLFIQLIQDCSAPIITENNYTKKIPPSDDNLVVLPENDSLKSEPISVEIASNKPSDSEQFSDEISDEPSEEFEPFYQENEFDPFELDTFNLTEPKTSSSSSEIEEAWITSHVGDAWVEKDFSTDWELEKNEKRVSTLSQKITGDEIIEEKNNVSDGIQIKQMSGAVDEESLVAQLENQDNFSNKIEPLSIEDMDLFSDFTQEKEQIELLDSVTTRTKELQIEIEESESSAEFSTIEHENNDSSTKVEELPFADSEFDEELPITNSELDEELLNTQETIELTNDKDLFAEEDNFLAEEELSAQEEDDNFLADDFELPLDEVELSAQESDLLRDSVIEQNAVSLVQEPKLSIDPTTESETEFPPVSELDLSTDSLDETDEFSSVQHPDLLTDDSIDNSDSDLLSEDKKQIFQETDSFSDDFYNDSVDSVSEDAEKLTQANDLVNSVSEDTEPLTPVSDLAIEKEELSVEELDLPNDEEELSDHLSTLDEDNLLSENIDELQFLTDDETLSETSQTIDDLSGEEQNLSAAEETFQVTDDLFVEEQNLSATEETLSDTSQVTDDLLVDEQNLSVADNQSFSIEKTDDIVEQSKSSNEIILCSQEVLELLIGQISETAEDNANLLTDLLEAEGESEQVLTATMTYTENVQAIWDVAEMASLNGLQDICTFVNDNVMALGSQSQTDRKAARDVLLAWHENVIAYLQNPVQNVDMLISGLQNEHWPIPLDNEAALALKQSLLTPATAEIEQTVVDDTLPTSETEKNEFEVVSEQEEVVSEQEIILAPPEVLELLIAQVSDISENNAELINELMEAEEGSEAVFTAITTYTENVQAVWDAAEMADLNGLLEVCAFINDNVMALGGLPQSDREAARSILLAWPELMIAYLQNPNANANANANALVNLMQDSQWPSAMEEAIIENLLISLTTNSHSESEESSLETSISESSTEASSETLVLATPDIVELVCNQIIDSQDGLSAALEVCISMENNNPAFLEAIEDYTGKVQEIVDVAEMAGLTGLIEVCTFINTNFVEFSIQEKTQRIDTQKYFLAWPAKVLTYLHSPNTGASQLISFMQEDSWPDPLSEEAAIELLTLLTQPAQTDEEVETTSVSDETEVMSVEPDEDERDDDDEQELTPLAISIPDEIKLCKPADLEVLLGGIEFGKEDLTQAINQLVTLSQQEAAFTEAQENYIEPLQHWSAASEMVGLEALQTICEFVTSNVNELHKIPPEAVKKAKKVLEKWPDLVLAYLQAPTENAVKLVNHFRLEKWVKPLNDEAAQVLLTQLVSGVKEVASEQGEVETRQIEAHPDDVLLVPNDDLHPELWEAYLQELPQNAEAFSESIQKIIQEPDIEEIKSAQRVAHTMKGSSRIVGVKGIASIAHHLEDTLEYLAEHQVVPPEALTNMMMDAADCLAGMVDALSGVDEPPSNALEVLQSVLNWANQIDKGELDAPPVPKKPKKEPVQSANTSEVIADKKPETDNKKKADKQATPEQMLQVPTKTIDELMRLVGELSISLGQIQEKLKHVTQNTRHLTERDLVLQHKTFALENLVDVRGITGVENRYPKAAGGMAGDDEENFDPLEFEEYNELHSVAHSFTESIADNRELALSIREELSELETMFIHQERLNQDFQSSIMTTRMKQVKTIISQLERNVRQTANQVNKKAILEVTGADILVDSEVLNNLIAPLRHILNNAVDHGLEPTEERAIVGKSEVGTISLKFYREGNNVAIKCQDDGQGLNYTNIRFKAIEKVLITENKELTEPELARLILMSGFSTKPEVTQVSGRGVGMDVVHNTIRQMKGTLDLTSETGKGTTFLIKLPMTLVTVHVLVVRVGERRFGIPTNSLEQALAPGIAEFHTVGEEITVKSGKNLYAIKYLADLLHMKGNWSGFNELEKRPIILVHEETGVTAVLVDEFLDTHDLVIKNMGNYVKNIHGVAGASILGDGSLVPLLDVPELLRSPMQAAISAYAAKHSVEDDVTLAPATPNIMIVDDSLSVRKSLSLLIENAGFEPVLAKDGVEAIEVMNEIHPNVMLVDMEMPRMDGLELTAHVRANQGTQNLPIFMITSRTTEKHRQQAKSAGVSAYLTKPYQEAELLGLIDKALTGQI